MKLKVCGMKYQSNIKAVATLQPDFMGFIFYEKSPRYVHDLSVDNLPDDILKVGVFVNAEFDDIQEKINTYDLNMVQLHGQESASFCKKIKDLEVKVIKVFSILNEFNFDALKDFEAACDYYLFDTKGELPGGNGFKFDWSILKKYPSNKPFFLSGGIGLEQKEDLKIFFESEASQYCYAIDVNSKFELEPGLKNIDELKAFKSQL